MSTAAMSTTETGSIEANSAATIQDPRRWKALGLLAIADFVVILDATIVNIALPSIGRHLHASTASLSWVISAYVLAFGALLLLGGRLADLFGRRKLFVGGLVTFGLASLAGGLSTSIGELIFFRAMQGAGAAALAPAARSIVTILFEEGPERSKAMGIWAAVAGSGSVVGLILGGILTSSLGWQWVLWVNVPVTLLSAAVAPRLINESRADVTDRSIDFAGAALVAGGLSAILYALVKANAAGWLSGQTLGLIALGIALLAAFVAVERRVASPLMPLSLFRLPQVRAANVAMVLTAAAMVGMFFVLALYQQQLEGYSALRSGLSQLPLGLVLIVVAGVAGPFTERVGAKPVLVAGLASFTAGVAWLSRVPLHGSYLTDILGPSLVIGLGLALAFVALTIASVAGVDDGHSGVAGGLINTSQQVGGAIGLAIITAVAISVAHGSTTPVTVDHGFQTALMVAAGIGALGTVAALVLHPRRRPATEASATGTSATETPATETPATGTHATNEESEVVSRAA
jgi:EmrB/QacA subfamily drug resistance transporter